MLCNFKSPKLWNVAHQFLYDNAVKGSTFKLIIQTIFNKSIRAEDEKASVVIVTLSDIINIFEMNQMSSLLTNPSS